MAKSLTQRLRPYGAYPEGIVDLRQDLAPDGLSYIDLFQKDRTALPDGVVESRGEPIAYVVDQESRPEGTSLLLLKKTVTLRGDAPYLAILEPGRLTVYDTVWSTGPDLPPVLQVHRNEERAQTAFHRLSSLPPKEHGDRQYVHNLLFQLLNDAIDNLIRSGIPRDDAISLAGRALFLRFLIDRQVLSESDVRKICPSADRFEQVFNGRERAAATCRWLDQTFNGDFLPLSFSRERSGFRVLPEKSLSPLEDIMYRSPGGQLLLAWGDLDFAHIPIGLLSQVYERQAEAWDPKGQRRRSIYYTPFRLAEFMVREVFAGFQENIVPSHRVRVLDPAAGGGVFLVSAFQEIVSDWWRYHRRPPDTKEIRNILYNQICGFEISEPALRLAALSLYLKAIELDLNPHPPEKLLFEPLRGKVLHQVGGQRHSGESEDLISAGSLDASVAISHRRSFDIVLGNPPWTTLGSEGKKTHTGIVAMLRPFVAECIGEEQASNFRIPDALPDLPFLWRAMEWAKPDGWLAFALHARLLFKNSEGGQGARDLLFQALSVTGILNGTDLRQTNVWPRIDAPFCLLFALNRRPKPEHAFYFTSPYREEQLNHQGRLRIDSQAAHPVEQARLNQEPELLKALFRGTALDVAVLRKIRAQRWPSIHEYLENRTGVGYQAQGRSQDPGFLKDLPNLTTDYSGPLHLCPKNLPRFTRDWVHRRRKKTIFEGPVAVVRKSPPLERERGRALFCPSDLAYNESFYGCSTLQHSEPEKLARHLTLIFNSELFLWHALMTSAQFGVERDTLLMEDVDSFPIPPPESLPKSLANMIQPLSDALFEIRPSIWKDLDDWVFQIYGINRWDQEVICDTLSVSLPYTKIREQSQRPPQLSEVTAFASRLERELTPIARVAGRELTVLPLNHSAESPWEVICIEASGNGAPPPAASDLRSLFEQADREGASQILLVQPLRHRLLLGILRQFRYWTQSRARLCALEIIEKYTGPLLGAK